MSRATRLRETWWPASARSAQILGTPYVPRLRAVELADRLGQLGVRARPGGGPA